MGINLTTHVLDVANEVRWKDLSNIVLCGHSYGGIVITGTAEHIGERVASMAGLERPAVGMIQPITR